MIKFKNYIQEQELDEAIITLGGRLYPKDGNVVIMAGGSASGKGFVQHKLLGIEGKTLDTDKIKTLVQSSIKIKAKIKEKYHIDVSQLDFKNAEHVNLIHEIVTSLKLNDRILDSLMMSILSTHNKPNIIFDVTLASMTKFNNIIFKISQLGYSKESIHIVWVLTEYEIAKQQNAKRSRSVPELVLKDTHAGAARTIFEITKMGNELKQFMDGDIWVVFNKPVADTQLVKSKNGGSYVKSGNYFKIKEARSSDIFISDDVERKIHEYIPK